MKMANRYEHYISVKMVYLLLICNILIILIYNVDFFNKYSFLYMGNIDTKALGFPLAGQLKRKMSTDDKSPRNDSNWLLSGHLWLF